MKSILRKIRCFYLRNVKWRRYTIGRNLFVGRRVYFWAKNQITIGDNFYIGKDSQIETDCTIGDNVIFANKVAIVGKYDHHFQKLGVPTRMAPRIMDDHYKWKGIYSKTVIEDDVWVGYGVIIMGGVRLGKGCIIASGSVVTKDTEPYYIYGGNPIRKLKPRFETKADLEQHLNLEKDFLKKHSSYVGVKGLDV